MAPDHNRKVLQPIRLFAAALLTLVWSHSVRSEPVSITPEEMSFAYPEATLSKHRAEQPQSLAAVLKDGAPSYVNSPAQDIRRAAATAAWRQNLPVTFFLNLIQQESSFRKFAVSRAGAVGIAQFMPAVASWRGLENPFEPESALIESARYLEELRKEFGNVGLAAAAYNAGPARLRNWLEHGRALPTETRRYVLAVTGIPVEKWATSAHDDTAPVLFTVARPPKDRQAPRPITHSMPQPSEFAIGKPVPSQILASERAVLARHGWKLSDRR